MNLTQLNAISPIDGRYRNKIDKLANYFSEEALIKYRVRVEIEYFIALCELPLPQLSSFDRSLYSELRKVYENFTTEDAIKIKDIEKVTNHDVKAVEYFIKEKFDTIGIAEFKEFIHFGLTSQDINNTAIPLSIKEAMNDVFVPGYFELIHKISSLVEEWKDIPMLARTHGQPASPTRLGKEFEVFVVRLKEQFNLLNDIPSAAKFGGATGNFNAHKVAYPTIDWKAFGTAFVQEQLGLQHSFPTTQIEHYDHMAALFDTIKRINTIILDLNRDIWTYISMDYFKQKVIAGEVGSSAMPHKVNPIDFENAEGNFGISSALLDFFANKLTKSRHQRDLSDSTVLRNIGLGFGYSALAIKSTNNGLNKITPNKVIIEKELNDNWEVLTEAVQTLMRYEGIPDAYEQLKNLSRGSKLDQESYVNFINSLKISKKSKNKLLNLKPSLYIGNAKDIAKSSY